MKRFLLTTVTVLFLIVLNAQTTEPLVSEGKQWNVIYRFAPWTPPQPPTCYTTCYKLEGDIMIDGYNYKLMLSTYREDLSGWTINAALREENGKVYYRNYLTTNVFNSKETLLYDFNMQIGDSINPYPYDTNNYIYLILDDVRDTIIGESEFIRKKYTFYYSELGYHYYNDREVWIEGVGSEFGIFSAGDLTMMGGSNTLLCSYENGELVWENTGSLNTCFYSNYDITGVDEIDSKEISVYPNPAKNTVNIKFSDDIDCQSVEIYAIDGRLLKSQNSNLETVDVSKFESGIYILKVNMADGRNFAERIVKE
ncbi:MAG: T9SS type A sorting domain-containing protein [Alphaproteobacteria bacterium]|nr:T9SS type A sorting domain-containing protein [Alphaproteobacteria bacterium]